MRKLLIGLALSVMATAAQAQWMVVGENTVGDKFYVDPTTKTRKGNIVRMWELADYAKPKVLQGKAYYSDRSYEQYDCEERTRQTLQSSVYAGKMATGEVVFSDNKPGNKFFSPPGTSGETILNFACK
jgi:hypothetical protein